ncbi:hypothetical protein NTE19_003384 [Vibrio fluvialis]|nr:hypothetical protein [Vibrio fluvialis]
MIALVFCLALAFVVGVLSFAASRSKATHSIAVVMFFISASLVLIGIVSYPVCEHWWSEYQIQIEANRTQAESERAKTMIRVLGSPENYIRYLKDKS